MLMDLVLSVIDSRTQVVTLACVSGSGFTSAAVGNGFANSEGACSKLTQFSDQMKFSCQMGIKFISMKST
jgi:hypothetical protein